MTIKKEDSEQLKLIAQKVIDNAHLQDDEKFGSIIIILTIISIILTTIRVLQECNKNKLINSTSQEKYKVYGEQIKEFSNRRGWFTRMRIKKIIRRELNKEDYEKYSLKLTEAMLNIGETLTDDEIKTLVEAANV
jgi:hypothetical protein